MAKLAIFWILVRKTVFFCHFRFLQQKVSENVIKIINNTLNSYCGYRFWIWFYEHNHKVSLTSSHYNVSICQHIHFKCICTPQQIAIMWLTLIRQQLAITMLGYWAKSQSAQKNQRSLIDQIILMDYHQVTHTIRIKVFSTSLCPSHTKSINKSMLSTIYFCSSNFFLAKVHI